MMSEALSGLDIGKIMAEEGTIVKCVLLRCGPVKSEDDSGDSSKANAVAKPICSMSIKEIKRELESYDVDASMFVEKDELVSALEGARQSAAATESMTEQPLSSVTDSAVVTQQDTIDSSVNADADAAQSRPQRSSPDATRVPLAHLIHEISVDTTPRKSQVASILGGDFTFLGQYESEGVVLMIRRPDWEHDHDDPHWTHDDIPPINPHKLHPPFDGIQVRGDILFMRVAETDEQLDQHHQNDHNETHGDTRHNNHDSAAKIQVPASEEFFLDYTREEYLKFAARTDVVWEGTQEDDDCEEEDDDEETDSQEPTLCETNGAATGETATQTDDKQDQHDPNYDPEGDSSDEEYDSEEHQIGMMNLILGQILRKFHEENGRGPNTLELLDMRKTLADKLGVEVPEVDQEACDWNRKVETPKRHNKKVVVDEERNKCETIHCGDEHEDGGEHDEEGLGSEHEHAILAGNGEDEIGFQQLTGALENGTSAGKEHEHEQEANKTQILENGSDGLKRPALENLDEEASSDERVGKRIKREDESNACSDS